MINSIQFSSVQFSFVSIGCVLLGYIYDSQLYINIVEIYFSYLSANKTHGSVSIFFAACTGLNIKWTSKYGMNTFGKNDKSRERASFVIFDMLGKSMRIASSTPCHFAYAMPYWYVSIRAI